MKPHFHFLAASLASVIAAWGQTGADVQTWTASDGRTVQAKFIKLDGNGVTIETEGRSIVLALATLSPDSVAMARRLAAQVPPATAESYDGFTPATFRKYPPVLNVMDKSNIDYALLGAAIFHATNAERLKNGLPPFRHSTALSGCAFGHSRDMSKGGFFSHDNPKDASKRTPWQRMEACGVREGFRAENIASRGATGLTYLACADLIVVQWMKSRGHRENILNRKLNVLGCGAHECRCSKFHVLATQNFGS